MWTKYRFEKMNPATPAWWVPEGFNIDAPNSAGIRAPRSSCQACGKESAQLYEEGWTCLYRECTAFWTHEGRKITNEDLHYLDSYLHERNPPRISVRPAYSFKPKPLVTPPGVLGFSTSRACWKGFCCPDCGRCNSRIEWSGWECIGCGLKHDAPHIVFSAALISNGDQPLPSGHAFPSGSFLSPVIAQDSVHGKYRRQDLEVPGAGRIVIFRSNTVINAEENGPDHMFEDLQRPDHPLRRLTIENGRVSKLITRHFAMNHGMSYKYAAAVATNPMSGAPESVRHAMGRLTWAKNLVEDHDQRTPTANEILTLGYMEDQSIGVSRPIPKDESFSEADRVDSTMTTERQDLVQSSPLFPLA